MVLKRPFEIPIEQAYFIIDDQDQLFDEKHINKGIHQKPRWIFEFEEHIDEINNLKHLEYIGVLPIGPIHLPDFWVVTNPPDIIVEHLNNILVDLPLERAAAGIELHIQTHLSTEVFDVLGVGWNLVGGNERVQF